MNQRQTPNIKTPNGQCITATNVFCNRYMLICNECITTNAQNTKRIVFFFGES
ncbi:hypothetical protein HanXRQr2_Chr04g0184331 [Helianthus annuus]|uniref:Uncharacterized protein n=1 Tax=Helianthus annuus TaxID=4232 RepID=A0A9K3JC84_HELAN|nr:hypothetical protein HanXRQr2_Chr04g0184331 [Helianthus annuus]KAJ0582312.1 hypothetical protein HanHA300_Chr04g0150851 [Helianthus annuus]KAJ0590518.1 hypothetical protein HanIR_Chr04g0198341 [Helianthus annuus]KAJ0598285.1 hypothetical protein HanHA89_Chr04g0164131 [Helianthus annuus]KAJ0758918.1 hypothetical protein HanLR1_Chr04g0155711 [Helianthus annuus]